MGNYFYYLFIGLTFIFLCLSLETLIKDFKETINTIKNNLKQ
jgi:hypothetical protein